MFAKEPMKYVMGSMIKIGYFKSNTELIYQDVIEGNLFEQVDKVMELIFTKYLSAFITYEGIQRVESFPISELAFREALINAVVHKDYSSQNSIQISVYDDKLLMWNAGDLPSNWTIDTLLRKHTSEPHNPLIAYPFFLAGYIESWGRGIEKIIEESQKFNGITPQFRWENGLWVEFYFNNTPNKIENTETRVKTRVKTREKILELISANPNITNQELADMLQLTVKGIEWQIKKLKEDGNLERIGGAKGGHWEVKK